MRLRTYLYAVMCMAISADCTSAEEPSGVCLASAETADAHALLQAKLKELDRLQREIATLRAKTKSHEQIVVKVKMLEINLTKMQQRDMDLVKLMRQHLPGTNPAISSIAGGGVAGRGSGGAFQMAIANKSVDRVFDALEQQSLGKILAEPNLVVLSGRPSSMNFGGEFPIPCAESPGVEFRKYGTQLDVTATSLGNNRVRLEARPRISELDSSNAIKVAQYEIPSLRVRQIDTAVELESGQVWVMSGLVEGRTVTITTESGTRDEVEKFALVVLLAPEIVH